MTQIFAFLKKNLPWCDTYVNSTELVLYEIASLNVLNKLLKINNGIISKELCYEIAYISKYVNPKLGGGVGKYN